MRDLITKVYEYSEHRGSDKIGAVSTTTLIGPLYKAKLAMNQTARSNQAVAEMYKRSSTLGSAFHNWAEKALVDEPFIHQEVYKERELDGHLITGSCDLLVYKEHEDKWYIGDWKTGYGKARNQEALDKDKMQLSIYRWLLQDSYTIEDEASILFISQSNNVQEEYKIELMSLELTEEYISNRLYEIEKNESVDCNFNVRFNMCTYCDFICDFRKEK